MKRLLKCMNSKNVYFSKNRSHVSYKINDSRSESLQLGLRRQAGNMSWSRLQPFLNHWPNGA